MFDLHPKKSLIVLSILALFVTACGSASQEQANISTAVAQTVAAQNSLTKVAGLPTLTPPPASATTQVPDAVLTNTPAPVVGAPGCTVSANLVGEAPPDEVLLKPSEYFWKTWSLENTGTCTWDATYKLVYRSGDLLGGLVSYPLAEQVAPGETKDVTIYLQAPDTTGPFIGYWSLQTPWNTTFGIGPGNSPFYVEIVVSDADKPNYGITSVTYNIVREPETGCPVNVLYTVYATITANGPYELQYYWDQSDGNESGEKPMKFDEAGSITISREWMVGRGDSPNPRWMQIIVTEPVHTAYDKAVWPNNCP